jgi:hypothetical protein
MPSTLNRETVGSSPTLPTNFSLDTDVHMSNIVTAEKGGARVVITVAPHLATPERMEQEQRIANWRADQLSR